MDPFIRSDHYNFIKRQTQILVNGYAAVKDAAVLDALSSIAKEKVVAAFNELSDEQNYLLDPITDIKTEEMAGQYLEHLKPYVVPFGEVTEQTISKLFPKTKKLKMPPWEEVDFNELSYLGWNDSGSNKKYIVANYDGQLVGLQGDFKNTGKKGICALCNGHEEVGMFISSAKGARKDNYIKKGNYICCDSQICNSNIRTLDKLNDFISRIIS